MRRAMIGMLIALVGAGLLVGGHALAGPTREARERMAMPQFVAVDVHVDPGRSALAAFQFEFTTGSRGARIVAVEEGESAAFQGERFYYDGKVISRGQSERVIVASFSTQAPVELPSGRTRVARIHVMIEPGVSPAFAAALTAAADPDGKRIDANVTCTVGTEP